MVTDVAFIYTPAKLLFAKLKKMSFVLFCYTLFYKNLFWKNVEALHMKRQPLLVNKNFDVLTTHDGFLHFRRKIWQLNVTLQTSAVGPFSLSQIYRELATATSCTQH